MDVKDLTLGIQFFALKEALQEVDRHGGHGGHRVTMAVKLRLAREACRRGISKREKCVFPLGFNPPL